MSAAERIVTAPHYSGGPPPQEETLGRRLDHTAVELRRFAADASARLSNEGLVPTVKRAGTLAAAYVTYPRDRRRRQKLRFPWGGTELAYELGSYNRAWLNERTVEIPIARHFLAASTGPLLEVGNVLGHYGVRGHTVLDRYEKVVGVINEDIVGFRAGDPYSTIVAISTLEHVGFDEPRKDPEGPIKALDSMRAALASDGRMLVTCPIGYNASLDAAIRAGSFTFPLVRFLKRISAQNDWREVEQDEALSAKYGYPFRNANAIIVGMQDRTE